MAEAPIERRSKRIDGAKERQRLLENDTPDTDSEEAANLLRDEAGLDKSPWFILPELLDLTANKKTMCMGWNGKSADPPYQTKLEVRDLIVFNKTVEINNLSKTKSHAFNENYC